MKKGIALILTTIIIAIAMAMVFGVSGIFFAEIVASQNIDRSITAFYVADAGIEGELYRDRILNNIPSDPFYCNDPAHLPLNTDGDACLVGLANGGTYAYSVSGPVGNRRVISAGTYRGTKRTIGVDY